MGSYNVKCMASNMTVKPGDLCYLMAVSQQNGGKPVDVVFKKSPPVQAQQCSRHLTEPDAFWQPESLFIEARYTDSWDFDIVKSEDNFRNILDFIQTLMLQAFITLETESDYPDDDWPCDVREFMASNTPVLYAHDNSLDTLAFSEECWNEMMVCWGYINDVVIRQRLFIGPGLIPSVVQFSVIHSVAYDYLLQYAEGIIDYKKEKTDHQSKIQAILTSGAEILASDLEVLWPQALKLQLTPEEARQKLTGIRLVRIHSLLERVLKTSMHFDVYDLNRLSKASDLVNEGRADSVSLYQILKPSMDIRSIMEALSRLEIKISPQVYADTDLNDSVGREYASFVMSVCDVLTSKRSADREV